MAIHFSESCGEMIRRAVAQVLRDPVHIHLTGYEHLPRRSHLQFLHITEHRAAEQLLETFLQLEFIQSEFPADHRKTEVR